MNRNKVTIICITLILIISGLSVGLYFLLRTSQQQQYKGAVATSSPECTDLAVDILIKGGSAADSVVTATLCQGLTVPQSAGLGGGFLATIYIKETGIVETVNSREKAPLKASKDMFLDDISSREGGLAVAVPGELKGLWEIHQKFGILKWEEVIQPVIDLAENGFKVSQYLSSIFVDRSDKVKAKFNDFYINPKTGNLFKEGDIITNIKLAETLKIIAREGANAIYGNGSLAQKMVDEITAANGIITSDDLISFKTLWEKPITSKLFNGDILNTISLPATGHVMTFILNILNGYNIQDHSLDYHQNEKLLYHRMLEAFKFGFAKRSNLGDESTAEVIRTLSELGNVEYANHIRSLIDDDRTFNDFAHYAANYSIASDHGTGHISILAPNGDAIGLTSTINYVFGAWFLSDSMGIFYNNEMNDFSIPNANSDGLLQAPANFIAPGKSPMSSMSPTIIINAQNDVSLIAGGAGGILILTSLVGFLVNYVYLTQSLEFSIKAKRLHHQLQPMSILHERGYDEAILKFLESRGHKIVAENARLSGFASLNAIGVRNGKIDAQVDLRRGGSARVF